MEIPADLRRLWRLPTSSRMGRPAELDVDRVVAAAVELADADGLDGVTLQKVAQALGVTKMSLYRHVGSKDELAELMFDHASGPVPDLAADLGWREGVRQWAAGIRARYAAHPWMADMPITGPPRGPNGIGWMDAMLRVLRGSGLDVATRLGVLSVVSGYLRNAIVQERQFERGSGVSQAEVEQDYSRALAGLVDPARFPDAAEMFTVGVLEQPTDEVAFGLELILDGVAATIAARR